MLLCDAAQAVNGKLYVLGGGWNVTGPDPAPSAIAIQIDVPWDRTNTRHTLRLDLVTDDGQPVPVPSPSGQSPAQITAEFEVGRPAGHRAGSPLSVVLAINLGPLPLPTGVRMAVLHQRRDARRLARRLLDQGRCDRGMTNHVTLA
jgi:hypothetical protein